jgi:hypothetical protein
LLTPVKPNPSFLVETFTHSFHLPFLFILFKNLFLFRSFLLALFIPLQFLSSRYILESCSYSHFTISLFFSHIMLHTIMRTSCTACLFQTSFVPSNFTLFFYIARNNLESINFEYSAILLHQSLINRARSRKNSNKTFYKNPIRLFNLKLK